jgi:hypothetical protein
MSTTQLSLSGTWSVLQIGGGGGQFSVAGSHCGDLHFGSSGLVVQSGLHDGSLGFALQSTGEGVVHDGSSGFVLQSTGGFGPQDGSLGLVLQSTGCGVVLHDGSLGFVLQSIGPGGGGSGTLEHSGELVPCSHVAGWGGG